MARGNRCEAIVFGDDDRRLFVDTLGEACGRTGWEVWAIAGFILAYTSLAFFVLIILVALADA